MQGESRFQPLPKPPTIEPWSTRTGTAPAGPEIQPFSCGNTTPSWRAKGSSRLSALVQSVGNLIYAGFGGKPRRGAPTLPASRRCTRASGTGAGTGQHQHQRKFLKLEDDLSTNRTGTSCSKQQQNKTKKKKRCKAWGLKFLRLRPRVRLWWGVSGGPVPMLRKLKESYVPMMITFTGSSSGSGKLVELDTVSCHYCCRRGFHPDMLCEHCQETSSGSRLAGWRYS